MKYEVSVLGGTFDRLHKGHTAFLAYAFSVSKTVVIGITSDSYVVSHKADNIQSYVTRRKAVEEFLTRQNWLSRAKLYEIDDEFGPAASSAIKLNAIIVTPATLEGAHKLNTERAKRGLTPLAVDIFPLVAEHSDVISSTRIRSGQIGRDGKKYVIEKTRVLGSHTREVLQEPLGRVYPSVALWHSLYPVDAEKLVTVGDVATNVANELHLNQRISVVDFWVERTKKYSNLSELGFNGSEQVYEIRNPAGTLQKEAADKISGLILEENARRIVLQVEGEEDLLVVPFILFLPLGYTILYGQPKTGVVVVEITEELKEKMMGIMAQFEQ